MQMQGPVLIGNYSFNQNHILGKGVTGNVYKGTRLSDNLPVAIKAINLKLNQNQITMCLLQTQLKALKLIKPHPNLIRTFDIIEDQNFCFIITELYSGGSLKQLLQKQGFLKPQLALQIFHKIITGYCAISDSSIIHRDLKPANIMLKQGSIEPVIIDFGFAQIIQTKTAMKAFNVGSPAYMAPQAFSKTLYSEKSDVWSLGIILYQMLTGETLDDGIETKKYFSLLSDSFICEKISSFGQIYKQILSQVLKMNPFQRISIHKIKYIIDKHTIMKLNNPIKSLHSSIEFGLPIISLKSQPLLMNRSNTFVQDWNNKGVKSIYQSGHFDMCNSAQNSFNAVPNNLTAFKGNNHLNPKLAESRYEGNLISPSRFNQVNEKTQINRSIEKANQFEFKNLKIQNIISSNSKALFPSQNIQISLKLNNRRYIQSQQNNFKSNQQQKVEIEYLAFRPSNINVMKSAQQKQYFNKPHKIIKPSSQVHPKQCNQIYLQQFGKQNVHQPLLFKQRLNQNKQIVKQQSPNPQKFSFKKMAEYQEMHQNQNLKASYHPIGKQNSIAFRDNLGQSITQLNFNQNYLSLGPQSSKLPVRNYIYQPLISNGNIRPQRSEIRRMF